MSLTLEEARARAALVSDVSYDLELDLTDRATYGCRATVRFSCAEPGSATFLELTDARDLRVDGVAVGEYDGRRIPLFGLDDRNEVTIEARMPYVTDGDGMHTFTDPADGEVYVSAYCGMDVAQRVFPCFDQNDLKAPVTLRVRPPGSWTVLANGRAVEQGPEVWRFATTPPLPPAMFVVCAGPWRSSTWEHAGLPFGWHARASLAGPLERDAAELRRVTEACFDHYTRVFEEPFPFDSYDQVMVPGQNWGALETPGCITYRDEYLPLGEPTEPERRSRATVIAHEMAHMWFGDLVTMTWWEDTWLQESFADYLGFRVAEEAAGFENAFVDFTMVWRPGAHIADERRSTHPVAPRPEDVPDVDAASVNFDALSYAKGGAALRQLVTWLGDDDFFAGINAYLHRHRFGNASLTDFVDALEGASERDVRGWVDDWLRSTGFDTLRLTRDEDGPVLTREGVRPHRVAVASYDASLTRTGSDLVDVGADPVRLDDAALVVPNAGGETFARLRLDPTSWALVSEHLSELAEADTRAVLWTTAFDLVWCGELAPDDFLDLVHRHLPGESHVDTAQSVLDWAQSRLVRLFVPADDTTAALARIAVAVAAALDVAPSHEKSVVLSRHLAATTADAAMLHGWLSTGTTEGGVAVDPTLRWLCVGRLASLGGLTGEQIDNERKADGTIVGTLGAARASAALPDAEAKAQAWARMTEDPGISNREFEALAQGLWHVEHAPLVRDYVERYFVEGPPLAAARGVSFSELLGDAFPKVPLDDAQVAALERALEREVPPVLRRAWEDNLDDVRRGRRTSS